VSRLLLSLIAVLAAAMGPQTSPVNPTIVPALASSLYLNPDYGNTAKWSGSPGTDGSVYFKVAFATAREYLLTVRVIAGDSATRCAQEFVEEWARMGYPYPAFRVGTDVIFSVPGGRVSDMYVTVGTEPVRLPELGSPVFTGNGNLSVCNANTN
jgi:hypothetical protein